MNADGSTAYKDNAMSSAFVLGFGVGAPKQYFIIKKIRDKLRGMVCGTCDNP